MLSVGSRDMVWDGSAERTTGGLRRKDLILNSKGMLVSKKASESASKRWVKFRADRVRSMLPIIESVHDETFEESVELPIIELIEPMHDDDDDETVELPIIELFEHLPIIELFEHLPIVDDEDTKQKQKYIYKNNYKNNSYKNNDPKKRKYIYKHNSLKKIR